MLSFRVFGIFRRDSKLQREITRVSERIQERVLEGVPNAFRKVFRTRSRRCSERVLEGVPNAFWNALRTRFGTRSERVRSIRLLLSSTVGHQLLSRELGLGRPPINKQLGQDLRRQISRTASVLIGNIF